MKRRILMLTGLLVGGWFSAQGAISSSVAQPPPVAMPEPSGIAELGVTLSGILGYCWWRVSRRKRQDS